ncbi:MAG: endonuclease/exonuclease/phosphatase family protein, partial [Treponema sp.]|nr:endonuclease/exonuclease/phosphatase family protein [Treponema sp.]
YEIIEGKSHSISINGETTPRPVLEARIQADSSNAFVVFACHWKSKIGGDEATENVRMASARVILRLIRDLHENEPDTGIIVAGDLNENHNEFFKRGASSVCALLPDDPKSALIAKEQKDYLVISGNMPPLPVYFPPETVVLFSPWMNELEFGSYYYKGNWETIDHFLISHQFFDGADLEYKSAYVADFEPFANRNGIPVSYNQRTGNGLSDHLPLLIYLKY